MSGVFPTEFARSEHGGANRIHLHQSVPRTARSCFLMPTQIAAHGVPATGDQRKGFQDLRRRVDLNYAQSFLSQGALSEAQWARLARATTLWPILPALLGLRPVMRAEVK
jgi:hypothetical protein